jgi:hypothetical protein
MTLHPLLLGLLLVLGFALLPFLVSCLLVRVAPRARYLPSMLVLFAAVGFLISAAGERPSSSSISSTGDLAAVGAVIAGIVLLLAATVTFILTRLVYRRRAGASGSPRP